MASLIIGKLTRSDDEFFSSDHTVFTSHQAIVVNTITRRSDEYALGTTITWSSENDWRNVLTPLTGETGEVWLLFTDTADSDKKHFQVFGYNKTDSTTISFTTSATAGIIDIGASTVKMKLQNSAGTIQALHTAGANRSCNVKIRLVRHA